MLRERGWGGDGGEGGGEGVGGLRSLNVPPPPLYIAAPWWWTAESGRQCVIEFIWRPTCVVVVIVIYIQNSFYDGPSAFHCT